MSDNVEHGPKGGVVPEDLRSIRKVPTLMGQKNEDGTDFIEFPGWFSRVSVRTAEIDTGFGTVTVKAGTFSEKELESDTGYLKLLTLLVDLPEWKADYDITLPARGKKDNVEVPKGEEIPSPDFVLAYQDAKMARIYVEECMPPSLLQQVLTAQYFLRLPPIAYVPPQTED